MSHPTPAAAPPSNSSRALRDYAWCVLAYNVVVILWGAAVRATGSGAGCGEHWPLCNGSVIQQHPTVAALIEYTHRATSGIALIAVIVLLVWTFRATPKRHIARIAAVVSLILILNEAFIGALLVLLGMTADNQSPSRAFYLALHLTNTLLMLGALALTAHFLSRGRGFLRGTIQTRHLALNLTGLIAIIVTGITGSIAALSDTLYPSISLRSAFTKDFSTQASWLVRIRWIHPIAALIAGLFVLEIIIKGTRIRAHHRHAASLILLLLLQYALGAADLAFLTPLSLQILHLLGADLLWIALVVLAARLSFHPLELA
ncbi:MAG TPA: COX15/CtaA family protein [Silvibacterium sp.]|nr:COX15/CtaA family protein [Silvibacterium sp.]